MYSKTLPTIFDQASASPSSQLRFEGTSQAKITQHTKANKKICSAVELKGIPVQKRHSFFILCCFFMLLLLHFPTTTLQYNSTSTTLRQNSSCSCYAHITIPKPRDKCIEILCPSSHSTVSHPPVNTLLLFVSSSSRLLLLILFFSFKNIPNIIFLLRVHIPNSNNINFGC